MASILGLERPVEFTGVSLFDPTVATMLLQSQQAYASALRQDYKDQIDNLKEFSAKFGDFVSPFEADNEYYYNNTTGGIAKMYDALSSQGVDPLRSVEGRNMISRYIATRPYANIAKLRQSAAAAREYMKNRGELEAKNLYDQDYENWILNQQGLPSFNQWSTIQNGEWTRTSPAEFKTLNQATSHWFDDMKGSDKGTKNGYRMFGIDDKDLLEAANPHLQGFTNSQLGRYYLEQISKQIRSSNPTMNESDVQNAAKEQLLKNVAFANKERKFMKADADQFALENLRHRHEMSLLSQRIKNSGGSGGGSKEGAPVIFREAAARNGESVGYDTNQNPHYQWMDPLVEGARLTYSKKNNEYGYTIPSRSMGRVYRKDSFNPDGTRVSARWDYGYGDAVFRPTGQMRMLVGRDNKPHYYITGTLINGSSGKTVRDVDGGSALYEMEVTERAYNYGSKQKTTYAPNN